MVGCRNIRGDEGKGNTSTLGGEAHARCSKTSSVASEAPPWLQLGGDLSFSGTKLCLRKAVSELMVNPIGGAIVTILF